MKEANHENTKRDFERYSSLFKEKVVSASYFDRVKMQYETSLADVNAAERELKKAKANLDAALASKGVVNIKRKQLESAEANYKAALARLSEAEADLRETKIYAPSDGTVMSRPVEDGEVVNPGTPLICYGRYKQALSEGIYP